MADNVTAPTSVPVRRKIVGFYVVHGGEQIAWFALKARARALAIQIGGTVQPEYDT